MIATIIIAAVIVWTIVAGVCFSLGVAVGERHGYHRGYLEATQSTADWIIDHARDEAQR